MHTLWTNLSREQTSWTTRKPLRQTQDLLIPVEQRPRKGFEIRESKILGAEGMDASL